MESTWVALYNKLKETETFPLVYMFKFLLPSENHNIALLTSMFGDEAEVIFKTTSTGKYTSISIKTVMTNPEEIIETYQKASEIKGVIML
jgi:hypothetical protein